MVARDVVVNRNIRPDLSSILGTATAFAFFLFALILSDCRHDGKKNAMKRFCGYERPIEGR